MMKPIDMQNWVRKGTYDNFITYTNPVFSVTSRLNVTGLVNYCRKNKRSFFATFLYILTECVNDIDELRARIVDGIPVIYDKVAPSYVVLCDDGSIVNCQTEPGGGYSAFYEMTKARVEEIRHPSGRTSFVSPKGNAYIYISCLTEVDLVSVINPYDLKDVDNTSIPRITWGRFIERADGSCDMGIDVSLHHALADGQHISLLLKKISSAIEKIDSFLS